MDQIVVHTDKIVWQEWWGQIDQEIRKKEPKKKPQHGKRADFLAQYKVVGYEKAKEIINKDFKNKDFKREVFNDETLKKWIEEENEK